MQRLNGLCARTLLAALWAFLGLRGGHDWDSDTDFSRYKSFAWAAVSQHQMGF
jgi:hypothetical protein